MTFTLTFEVGKDARLASVVIEAEDWYEALAVAKRMLERMRYRGRRANLTGVGNGDYTREAA